MFDEKGQIVIDKEECDLDPDDLMMIALDAGAEDFSDEEDSYEIITAPDDLQAVTDALTQNKISYVSGEVTLLPQTYVDVTDEETVKQIQRILDLLEEDDDVQDVYTNWSDY
jgi:transcriptional/translational regulatory protein YebC/TACO1